MIVIFLLAALFSGCTNMSASKQREIIALWARLLQQPLTDCCGHSAAYQLQESEGSWRLVANEASWQELFAAVGLEYTTSLNEHVSLSLEASSMEEMRLQLAQLAEVSSSITPHSIKNRAVLKIMRPNHVPAQLLATQLQSSFNPLVRPCYVGTDPNHNLLFLRGGATTVDGLLRQAKQIDQPPQTILLEIVLVNQRTIDEWQMQPSATFKQGPITLDLFPEAATLIGATAPATGGGGKVQISVVDKAQHPSSISVNIDRFLQDGRSFMTREINNMVSKPQLAVLGGSTATLHIGSTGYRVFAEESPAQSTSIATRALPVGTSISITPLPLGRGDIDLDISVDASRFIFNATLVVNRNYINSSAKVRLHPGEAVHISGLRLFKHSSELRTFSWLRNVPWLGSWLGDIVESGTSEAYDVFIFAHAPRQSPSLRGRAVL